MSAVNEVNPEVTAVVQDYGNCQTDFIADIVSPRVKIMRRAFQYREFDKVIPYNRADDNVGCYSQVREVTPKTSKLVGGTAQDHGLEIPVCWDELNEAGQECAGLDLNVLASYGQMLASKVSLNRELRLKALAFDPTLFPVGYTHDQSGAAIGDGTGGTVDPLTLFTTIMEDAENSLNGIAMSEKLWWQIRRQPSMLGSSFARGLTSEEQFAALFGFDYLAIGKSFYNDDSGNKVRVLDDDKILLFHRNPNFKSIGCPEATFSFSPSLEMGMVGYTKVIDDNSMGLRGGVRVRVGEGITEVVPDYTQAHLIYGLG